jgi:hypothetical protein
LKKVCSYLIKDYLCSVDAMKHNGQLNEMTSTKLIGRDTMIARLVYFHNARIDRAFPNHSTEWVSEKKNQFSSAEYNKMSTLKICKEYDETFGLDDSVVNSADFDTPTPNPNIKYSAALMG